MKSETPNLDVLTLLDDYISAHRDASSNLKSTIWNISKARRQKGGLGVGFSYSALDIREELRADVKLQCRKVSEPELVEESNHEKKPFVLDFRGVVVTNKDEDVVESQNIAICNTGLRRRKGKDSEKGEDKKWSTDSLDEVEQHKSLNIDPIELFGAFPPKELKLAQKKAKDAMKSYIEAANAAAVILKLIEE
uniref:Vacuolar ATPase assembly protein VMA22 n=1 Tax=Chaetoceros debilis TaxID=122233 RepID=A0A7S3V7H9_9STRA